MARVHPLLTNESFQEVCSGSAFGQFEAIGRRGLRGIVVRVAPGLGHQQ